MKKRAIVVGLATALYATAVHAETVGEKTGVNSTLGISPTTADFVKEAAVSDMFEVQSSKLAESRATGDTKAFASKMVADHTKTTSELAPLAKKANVELPGKLDDAHQSKLDKLQGLKGEEFAKQYRSDQDAGHKQAVSLFERYSKGGENAALKTWASDTLPHLQEHYRLAKDLDK